MRPTLPAGGGSPGGPEGIVDAKWFDQDEALSLIAYRDIERLFRAALHKLGALETADMVK